MSKKFPVEKQKTPVQYILAFFVLLLVGIVFAVVLIAVPYLLFLLVSIFVETFQFNILFILAFWLVVVVLLWIINLIELIGRYR
ncbi:hypothetical protein [Persephonella sp.]